MNIVQKAMLEQSLKLERCKAMLGVLSQRQSGLSASHLGEVDELYKDMHSQESGHSAATVGRWLAAVHSLTLARAVAAWHRTTTTTELGDRAKSTQAYAVAMLQVRLSLSPPAPPPLSLFAF